MTDAEREALVERMAIAAINARRAALGAPPVTDDVAEWLRTAPQRTTEIEAMRAAIRACRDAGGLVVRKMPGDRPRAHLLSESIWVARYADGYNAALAAVRAAAVEVE